MSRISASTVAYRRCGSLCIAVRHSTSRSAHSARLAARREPCRRERRRPPRGDRRALRLPLGDDRARFRSGVLVGQIERQPAREQLVEHHAERIHVGVDADAAAADLLGRGVRRAS